jgi:hypothetical protein
MKNQNGGDMEEVVILSFAGADVWGLLWKIVLVLALFHILIQE